MTASRESNIHQVGKEEQTSMTEDRVIHMEGMRGGSGDIRTGITMMRETMRIRGTIKIGS